MLRQPYQLYCCTCTNCSNRPVTECLHLRNQHLRRLPRCILSSTTTVHVRHGRTRQRSAQHKNQEQSISITFTHYYLILILQLYCSSASPKPRTFRAIKQRVSEDFPEKRSCCNVPVCRPLANACSGTSQTIYTKKYFTNQLSPALPWTTTIL